MNLLQRRRFLQTLALGSSMAIPGWVLGKNLLWVPDDLPLTPQQVEGPFYPEKSIEQQLYNDTNLHQKIAGHEFAKGQMAIVEGVIKNRKGQPLANAVVEVWQACATGRYNHRLDGKNPSLLDNNFQFWGRTITGQDGHYAFTTIIPGKYPGRTARHIHFRVDADDYQRCTTQCYFSDFGEDNQRDGLYMRLNRKQREQVTVEFDKPVETQTPPPKKNERKTRVIGSANKTENRVAQTEPKIALPWKGTFDIVMGKR